MLAVVMPPRICTCCDEPHETDDWYVINDHKHPRKGRVECAAAHEDRIRRECRGAEVANRRASEEDY
jgi:hypothetical protein